MNILNLELAFAIWTCGCGRIGPQLNDPKIIVKAKDYFLAVFNLQRNGLVMRDICYLVPLVKAMRIEKSPGNAGVYLSGTQLLIGKFQWLQAAFTTHS